MSSQWNDDRPMSPHLQIWRWHPAMYASILHRISIIIIYAALIKFAFALAYLTVTGNFPLENLVYSPLGMIGAFVGFFALTFAVLSALRHLIWDKAKMLDPKFNNTLSIAMISVAAFAALILTAVVSSGGLS